MNVEFFPFDQQTCVLSFASWTYDSSQVGGERGCCLGVLWGRGVYAGGLKFVCVGSARLVCEGCCVRMVICVVSLC